MNTCFIWTSKNWYKCGTITVFTDAQSHNPWKMFQGPKGNVSYCFLLFSYVGEKARRIKNTSNRETDISWVEEMLNQIAYVRTLSAHCNCCRCPRKKEKWSFCSCCNLKPLAFVTFTWPTFAKCRCMSRSIKLFYPCLSQSNNRGFHRQ